MHNVPLYYKYYLFTYRLHTRVKKRIHLRRYVGQHVGELMTVLERIIICLNFSNYLFYYNLAFLATNLHAHSPIAAR